jgi:uncharacterized protein RhaS with RHS repeats
LVGRYYDPATEQFLSVDPLVDETGTPYAFTDGDPVNGSDPSGDLTKWAVTRETVNGITLSVNANFASAVQTAARNADTPGMAVALLQGFYSVISRSSFPAALAPPGSQNEAETFGSEVIQFIQTDTGAGALGAWVQFTDKQSVYYNRNLAYYVWELHLETAGRLLNAASQILEEAMKKGVEDRADTGSCTSLGSNATLA